jgi:hypothetical protein
MERIVAGIALGVTFLVTASVFVPDDIHAEDDRSPADPWPSVDPHLGLPSLGELEDDHYLLLIHATDDGPRYSVYDRRDGAELGVLLTAEQVHTRFGDLPLPELDAGGDTALMLADPPRVPE